MFLLLNPQISNILNSFFVTIKEFENFLRAILFKKCGFVLNLFKHQIKFMHSKLKQNGIGQNENFSRKLSKNVSMKNVYYMI